MIHGLVMAAAIEAAAPGDSAPKDADVTESPRTDSFGRAGTVVLGEIVAARALTTSPAPIGVIGAAPGMLSAGWLSFGSSANGDYRMRSFATEPQFDVFVAKGVSLGAVIGAGVTSLSSDKPMPQEVTLWHATFMPRIGAAFDIANGVSVWARVAAGFTFFDWRVQDELAKVLRATIDVPFVFRLTRHVALQAGPQVSYFNHLGGPTDWRGFSGGVSGGLSITL